MDKKVMSKEKVRDKAKEGEAAEEIPDPEAEEEKEMLWGKLDTVDDGVDEMYENYVPKKL